MLPLIQLYAQTTGFWFLFAITFPVTGFDESFVLRVVVCLSLSFSLALSTSLQPLRPRGFKPQKLGGSHTFWGHG